MTRCGVPGRALGAVLTALVLSFGGLSPSLANPVAEAEAAAAALAAAAEALTAAEGAEDRVAALTATVRAYEDGLSALRGGLRQAEIRARAIETGLEAERAQLADLLAALLTIERTPPQVLLIHPSGPIGSARAGMMVTELTPGLHLRAEALGRDLQELALIRDTQGRALAQLETALAGVQAARADLARVMSERAGMPQARIDPAMLRALLQSADTLSAFALGLGGMDLLPNAGAGIDALRGSLPLPVTGQVLHRYRAADRAGITRPGLVLATTAGALVTAPMVATVRYAGPLLDYGNVIVLEPEAEKLLILAGMGTLFAQTGDITEAGMPLGLMPGEVSPSGGIDDSQRQQETLYLEFRIDQQPVDPAGWFATVED